MHKLILLGSILATGLTLQSAQAAELMSFRVCEDQHVLRTSDGAEAGHVEYIVVDPSEHRVVSTIVTGGVVADHHVAIPIDAMQFGAQREVTLTKITREQIVSAPVVETSRFTTTAVIEPSVFEKTYTHFGYDPAIITRTSTRTSVDRTDSVNVNSTDRNVAREHENTSVDARASIGTNNARMTERRDGAAASGADPAAVRGAAQNDKTVGGGQSADREAARAKAGADRSPTGNAASATDASNPRSTARSATDRSATDRTATREGAAKESADANRTSTRESARTPAGEDHNSTAKDRSGARSETGSPTTERSKSPSATSTEHKATSEESAPAGSTTRRSDATGSSEAKHAPATNGAKGHGDTKSSGGAAAPETKSGRPDAQ